MGCGCLPDVRGRLDAALFDPDEMLREINRLTEDGHAVIQVLGENTPLPFRADIAAAIEAGRLVRKDESTPGGVVVYLDENRAIIHFGLVGDVGLVTSRWAGGLVCRHGLFDLPRSHGEMAHFYAPAE